MPLPATGQRYVGQAGPVVDLEHFPEEACPGLDPGWTPVFRKEMRQTSNRERFPSATSAISWVKVARKALKRREARALNAAASRRDTQTNAGLSRQQ
jgi:hypothetical protein